VRFLSCSRSVPIRLTMDLAGTIMVKSDVEGVNGALNCVEASWVDHRRRIDAAGLDTP
jgi:hypothetical protein